MADLKFAHINDTLAGERYVNIGQIVDIWHDKDNKRWQVVMSSRANFDLSEPEAEKLIKQLPGTGKGPAHSLG